MLERLCHKTEFEVEGWRKIPPLIEKLQNHTDKFSPFLQLKMKRLDIAFKDDSSTTFKNTNIYDHFQQSNPKKLAVYVNATIPINEKYADKEYSMVSLFLIWLLIYKLFKIIL